MTERLEQPLPVAALIQGIERFSIDRGPVPVDFLHFLITQHGLLLLCNKFRLRLARFGE